ncbi:MAG: histidine phosphatase family protein [Myxococcota bacterium]|nr:histidine phosphatase family protein [Myxococcota bacterium]MDW8361044.1 histidine phosphatase family protein [Myxococcales bacterium]
MTRDAADDAVDIYLVRHAPAEPRGEGIADAERRLTERGRTRFAAAVRGLDALGIRFDRVLSSPWVRAVETAELLGMLCDGKRVQTRRLAARPSRALLEEIEGRSVALVGHSPWIGQLCAWLVTGQAGHGHGFRFKKGTVAHLRGRPEPGGCELRALWPPVVLRNVRR